MDKKYSNMKWIGGAIVLVATAVGTYFLYIYIRKPPDDRNEQDENIPKMIFLEQRDKAIELRKKGNSFFDLGQFEGAIEYYNKALKICPLQYHQDKAKLYQNRAAALHNLSRLDEALCDANKALEFSPRYKTALIRRSKIYESKGRLQDALFDTAAAVIFDSSEKSDSINRMDNIIKIKATKAVERELAKKPILQSKQDIRNYFQSFPNDPFFADDKESGEQIKQSDEQITLDCVTLLKMGKYEESFQAVEEALLQSNNSDEILSRLYLLRGTFYLLSCRENLALDDLALVISNHQSRLDVQVNAIIKQARLLLSQSSTQNIKGAFNGALLINPDCPDIYYHRGLSFEMAENRQAAINDYKRALTLYPDYSFAAAHNLLNNYMLSNKNQQKHFDEFTALLNRFPNCIEVHMIFVKVLMEEKRTTEAEQLSENLRLLHPDSGLIILLIARIRSSQHDISKAIEILREGIMKDPKHAELYHYLAIIYIKTGNLECAIELIDSAITHAKTRRDMMDYIEMREGIVAQLNVSNTFDIPVKDVLKLMISENILLEDI